MKLVFTGILFAGLWAASAQDVRFALTGDSIVNRRQSIVTSPAQLKVFDKLRNADVAFTNFETLIHNYEYAPAAQSGGVYMASPAWITDELKWIGIDIVSTANNHAVDYGADGLLSTIRHLDEGGIVHAGTGENLSRARAAGYLDSKRGRVALIAVSSTFPEFGIAGEQRPDVKGRPGLNPLRFTTTYGVDKSVIDGLRKLPGRGGRNANASQNGPFRFQGATFVESATPTISTKANAEDLEAIVRSVRAAKRQADWVIVSIHGHESAGARTLPAEFHVEFAHAVIDAGADIFVGHGPHVLRGVEIYKGKPILYSLGNFFFENESVEFLPTENYKQLDLPANSLPSEFYDRRSRNDTTGFPADRDNWDSAVAEVTFTKDGQLASVELTPIVLGYKRPRTLRGRPEVAQGEDATRILDQLAKLSAPFGTDIKVVNGVGRISPTPSVSSTGRVTAKTE